MRVLAQISRRSLSIQPNQDALYNTVVSASSMHLVDSPHWSGNTMCHQNLFNVSHLKIHVTVTRRANDKVRLTLNFFVFRSESLPSLLVPFE